MPKEGRQASQEFVTEAKVLVEVDGYDLAAKGNTLRDTVVFGVLKYAKSP